MQNDNLPSQAPNLNPTPEIPAVQSKKFYKNWKFLLPIVILLIGAGAAGWYWHSHKTTAKPAVSKSTVNPNKQTTAAAAKLSGLQLDSSKNYGNKYANGILPVGDGKYVTDSPKVGYIYTCGNYTKNIQTQNGGAGKRGPWFSGDGTTYDINQKLHVEGSVMWQAEFSNTVSGATRTIITNDLPNHQTGVFPISAADPAYAYDRNPNNIKGQTMTYALSSDPTYTDTPTCESGQIGVMLTGVALFNGFDAAGRDAGAWEVQDSCDGHPQSEGTYHYHTLSSCIKDTSLKTVIGFALDGYPITGPKISDNNVLTTADLDECHGITSSIVLDGKNITMYHYVMTQDFPYSASCFRSAPISPPGQQSGPR
jgi:hypothetical protein